MINSNPNTPTFIFDESPFHWQMTRCEKFAFASLLEHIKPEVAIEIGTHKGGSLEIISRNAGNVHSIDISADCRELLSSHFSNVEFHTGRSAELIPVILKEIKENRENLEFVLIDGDHSTAGVMADINAVLEYKPMKPLYVIFHDSFNPAARKGILGANWKECEFVHYVEVDFVPGVYHYSAFDTAEPRSMYGGLELALLLPGKREGELVIHQSQEGLFNTVYPHSCHARRNILKKFISRIFG